MMEVLNDLCEHLVRDIKELNAKGDISPTELERTYRAIDIIKDIKTIEAMERNNYDAEDVAYHEDISGESKKQMDRREELLHQIDAMRHEIERM